ncbi:3-methyl-2-oxobutanoate hydroxymethyltransferase [Salinisphaera sp. Q1T1-3]|uniref:3-methyl-2-oxobutanoate hydroxymethyltransferase n=1 Tax=Salinisphaera sp. Q1T1-3 TaxID=2321229 RepID=UPI000E767DEB|nr:3-methyl-2-oxobutanoate hydroxymethyltransferase [Salinisphaera sp. Q1T1-3]RJS93783.1 3-methyl-2-oxobutanoate hydroxymethyltransferase [Salinisphaera sp. Q1T1-3]
MNTSPYPHLQQQSARPVTLGDLRAMKNSGDRIACLTAYDASFAALEDRAGVDVVLVGDSLGMVVQGGASTTGVTLDDMVYHSRITAAGLSRAFLMTDLPFLTYATPQAALSAAHRLMAEGQAKMVKIEGGAEIVETVDFLTTYGVPVCAHLGLRPQMVHKLGGFKVQGRDAADAETILADAKRMEAAGADIVLLECVPSSLGARVAAALSIPVIGIGAGPDTDGQILVIYDILGLSPGKKPRFVQNFMADADSLDTATADYVAAVKSRAYPRDEHGFK